MREYLFSPHRPMLVHWVAAGVGAFCLALTTGYLVEAAFATAGANISALPTRNVEFTPLFVLSAIVLAPLFESLLLAWVVALLGRASKSQLFIAGCAGALAGLAHGPSPVAIASAAMAFFVFSSCFIAWRSVTFPKAYLAAAVPHAVYNTITSVVASNGA